MTKGKKETEMKAPKEQKELRTLTILHSNDIHGQFTGKQEEGGPLTGHLAQTAGYVAQEKAKNPNTIYCIAGDLFQGSLIDSDFLGLSTMDLFNLIDVDVMSIGNHELDYGISHLLFVEKYTDFPIINANFRMRRNGRTLFTPYYILERNGINILFIGLITPDIVDQTTAEGLIGSYVIVENNIAELRWLRKKLKTEGTQVDLTVLLTHIGYEEDLKLAAALDPSLGVDVIIGGHSHTYPEKAAVENGILIVQAGMENTHIGRLELDFDPEARKIADWRWELIPVDEEHCPTDRYVRAMLNTYVMDIDEKYGKIVTRLKRTLDNYGRKNPTELGQVFADAFGNSLDVDVMFMASSSMRCYSLDMTVTLQDLRTAYPYDGQIYKIKVTGSQLKKMVRHMLRDEVLDHAAETFFQTSKSLRIEYDRKTKEVLLELNGKPVTARQRITVGVQEFYYENSEIGFGMTHEELEKYGGLRIAAADAFTVLRDYLADHPGLGGKTDRRLVIKD